MVRYMVLTLAVAAGVALVASWAAIYALIKQQGRLLLRLDELGEHLDRVGNAQGGRTELEVGERRGVPTGTALQPFELPDLDGRTWSLDDLKGKRTLLVHWGARCGFCDRIAPDLAGLRLPGPGREQVVLVARDDVDTLRANATKHGLGHPILLLDPSASFPAFQGFGTPVAYLVDEEGRVARAVAVGAPQVAELARELGSEREPRGGEAGAGRKRLGTERPLSESRLRRDGLEAGTPAPSFSLPDLDGTSVSLEAFRGRRVLLAFTDPHCGPCEQLLPGLVRIHRDHVDNNLAVVMVGRGDPEENRRKAEQHRVPFPVLVQKSWEVSRAFGIFATPVAFLIDERGVIANDVARGVDEIVSLAAPSAVQARSDGP